MKNTACWAAALILSLLCTPVPGQQKPAGAAPGPTRKQIQGRPQSRAGADSSRKTGSPVNFEDLKAKAEAARDTDQIDEALKCYGQLVKIKPDWAEGWWHIGALDYDRDAYAAARDGFSKFVLLEPKNGSGWAMLGLCEYRLEKYADSLQHIVKARMLGLGENEELTRVVRFHQALLLNLGRQFEAALSLLSYFAVEKIESPAVLDAMGMSVLRIPDPLESLPPGKRTMIREFGQAAFMRSQRKREAIRLYAELEARYRGQPNVAYAYGVALLTEDQSEREKALGQFKKELERDPEHVPAMLQYAFESTASRNPSEGLVYAKKAIELEPKNFVAYYVEGSIYLQMDEAAPAVTALEEARNLAPRSLKVLYLLVQAYQRAGRTEDAVRLRSEFARLRGEAEERERSVLPYAESPDDQIQDRQASPSDKPESPH